jgi:glycerophosphoryl diester phosphodiesterase
MRRAPAEPPEGAVPERSDSRRAARAHVGADPVDPRRQPPAACSWAVCAHRGGSEDARPGTLEAFAGAASQGFDYVEFDVRRLHDGALVAFHDHKCGGRPLRDMTLPELRGAAGYSVPLVEEVMAALAGRAKAHIDLKEPGYEARVVALADALLGPGTYVMTTLEDGMVATIKRDFPAVRVGLSLGRGLAGERRPWVLVKVRTSELFPARRLRACGADLVSVHYRLARWNVLRVARRMGIPAFVWTVNDLGAAGRLLGHPEVECIITDTPGAVARLRGG